MKASSVLVLLSSALASAQYTYNKVSGEFTCTETQGLAAYCGGGGIIIRCNNGVGVAGNCNDNLAGTPPISSSVVAGCYQSSPQAGDAACTKGGLVFPASGSGASVAGPYPIPGTVTPLILDGGNVTTNGSVPQPPMGTGTSNGTVTTSYLWSNGTTGPVYVTTHPMVTITVPCSTASSVVVIPMPTSYANNNGNPTLTTSQAVTSPSQTTGIVSYTGGASILNGSPFVVAGALLLGAVL